MTLTVPTSKHDVLGANRRIKDAGDQRIMKMRQAVQEILRNQDPSELSVFTTGSDGRSENKPFTSVDSNPELTLYPSKNLFVGKLVASLSQGFNGVLDNIEVKKPDDSLIIYQNNPCLVFPTRIWDSRLLFGRTEFYEELLRRVSHEIQLTPKYTQKFYHRFRNHRAILKSGEQTFKWETRKVIDVENGVLYFDPLKGVHGVKPGPLRVIQYALALALARLIRDNGHPPFIAEIPKNIVDRLDYIRANKLTTMAPDEIENLKYIYAFFLNIHHEMQYRNLILGHTAFALSDDVLQDMREMLELLQETMTPDKFFKP